MLWGCLAAPFCGELAIGEDFDEDAADNAAGLKADLLAGFGVVPVGQWDAGWSFICPEIDGVDDGVELLGCGGECRGPYRPVEFGVACAAVEWETVAVEFFEVEGDFGFADGLGEEVVVEELIPDKIVFLAPGAGTVEGEFVVVAFLRHADPLFGHGFRCGLILFGDGVLIEKVGEVGVGGEGVDGFDGEVGVVSDVAGEVVGRELIFGVEAFLFQVFGPFGELGPITFCESCVDSARATASTRMSMLPLSSTGIWLSSFFSPPP